MAECDNCGLCDPECKCYLYEIVERIDRVEEAVDDLTNILKHITDYLEMKENE